MLAGLDVQSLRSSPLYKRHASELSLQIEQSRGELSIDPERDIKHALLAFSRGRTLTLVDGSFENLRAGDYFVRLESNVVAAGNAPNTQKNGTIPPALVKQMDQLPRADQVWVVSSQGFPLGEMPGSSDVHSALSNIVDDIESFRAGLGIDDGIHLRCDLISPSDPQAKRVHDGLRAFIGMARLMTKDDQLSRLKMYDAIQVDQDHSVVHVHADLNGSEADAAIALLNTRK